MGGEDTFSLPLNWLDIEFWSEDSIQLESEFERDQLEGDGFDLADDITVPAGDYKMTRHSISFRTNERRKVAGSLSVEFGDFYSGDILRTSISPIILPGALFAWRMSFEDIQIDLDEGDLDTQVISTNADFSFDPDLSWKNLLQYDTESEDLSWQSRLHWIIRPGENFYLVGLQGWDRTGRETFTRTSTDLALKFGYTWRF